EHIFCLGEVQSHTAGFQRDEKYLNVFVILKFLHLCLTVFRSAIEVGIGDLIFIQISSDDAQVSHKLTKYKYFVIFVDRLLQHIGDVIQFTGIIVVFFFDQLWMVGDLTQLGQAAKQCKLLGAPSATGKFADDLLPVVGFYLFVDLLLRWSHVGILHVGEFFRQVFGNLRF